MNNDHVNKFYKKQSVSSHYPIQCIHIKHICKVFAVYLKIELPNVQPT